MLIGCIHTTVLHVLLLVVVKDKQLIIYAFSLLLGCDNTRHSLTDFLLCPNIIKVCQIVLKYIIYMKPIHLLFLLMFGFV
jgi:hypothetical protein